MLKVVPVLLCGGRGTRLWPISRSSYPKQFISIGDDNQNTLLQATCERVSGIENVTNPILICNEEHRFLAAEQLRETNIKPKSIILEPIGRGTAPAISLAALQSHSFEKDSILLILSTDHVIKDAKDFRKTIEKGLIHAENDLLVTFGIKPESPETGYGYIEAKDFSSINKTCLSISSFVEKPNVENAKRMIKKGNFFWNSGIFMFKASKILKELEKFYPQINKNCRKALDDGFTDLDFKRIDKTHFMKCPDISIDVAVMEKTKSAVMIPFISGWNDIGTWDKVWEVSKKNQNGNSIQGKVYEEKCSDSLIFSHDRLIAALGIKNLIIVETKDALLISSKNESQNIKKLVEKLKSDHKEEVENHLKMYRPWGNYTSIEESKTWKVKKIVVKPKQSLSLQYHHHRSEHWIVVSGLAKVQREDEIVFLNKNESIFIPKGAKHRLINQENHPLVLIEVQTGDYLGEDDIIRIDDKYGRIEDKNFRIS